MPQPSEPLTSSTARTGTAEQALPRALAAPVLALCRRLEDRGISTWSQGEGLLDDLRPLGSAPSTASGLRSARTLLCMATPPELLDVLPGAVVTASRASRVTLATAAGPIDLLPVGQGDLERVLLDFGLSPFAFAFRPTEEQWCDPIGARAAFRSGILDIAVATHNAFNAFNAFDIAPRRYWIGARLLSAYALEPSSILLEAARAALPGALERLPQAAPARREVSRILASAAPERGLAFLRESGVSAAFFPGMDPAAESMIAQLGPMPALRWAAWLRGSAIHSALVRFRMPHTLARQIERLHRSHPIDRRAESLREVGIRKVLGRLGEDEINALFRWRRLELAAASQTEQTRARSKRLDEIEARIEDAQSHRERSGQVRALALDGKAVMTVLGAGPGPRVGRALAHLATFVEAHPDSNEPNALERELHDWASRDSDAIA